jgi:4-hydroxybenzoate polyprenyltransferase
MWKYIRVLRLEDQYVECIAILSAGLFIHSKEVFILEWAVAAIFLCIPAYILNELHDGRDGDKFTWNPSIHTTIKTYRQRTVVLGLFLVSSLLGLLGSWVLDRFAWGIAIWLSGILYSLPPIRLKKQCILDLCAQLFAFWLGPFLAVAWGNVPYEIVIPFIVGMSLLVGTSAFPYQLADMKADTKAGLQGTHVLLGLRSSLWFGLTVGIIGLSLYLVFSFFRFYWTIPFVLCVLVILGYYVHWIRMKSESKQLASIQQLIRFFKPFSQWMTVYFVWMWVFFN